MALKIGDRVKLLPTSQYSDSPENPHWGGRSGEIAGSVSIENYGSYSVRWDNGKPNSSYNEGSDIVLLETKDETMSGKFYRVVKDHPVWDVGAVVSNASESKKYKSVNELFDKESVEVSEYFESAGVVEHSDWFERVYAVNLLSKTVYKLKEEAKILLSKEHSA